MNNKEKIMSLNNKVEIKDINGLSYNMNFKVCHDFELGTMYIGNNSIMYLIDEKNKELALNAIDTINSLRYLNSEMKREFEHHVPKIINTFITNNKNICIIIEKEEDLILLGDLLRYHNGKLSFATVEWILNNLYNLVCFIHYNGICHNGITLNSYFISLKKRKGALLGGWWYARPNESKILKLPTDINNMIEEGILKGERSSTRLDLESIRVLGRILLGDKEGRLLAIGNDVPNNVKKWLSGHASDNPFLEYRMWCNHIMKI